MTPVDFPQANQVLGKDQPQYQPLPVHRDPSGLTVSCWRLTFWQRLKVLFTGRVWAMQLTFGLGFQPQSLTVRSPFAPAPVEKK